MSEWPKWICREQDGTQWLWNTDPVGDGNHVDTLGNEWIGVIPADLGEDMAKALRGALDDNKLDDRPWTYDVRRALTRYEREVGSD